MVALLRRATVVLIALGCVVACGSSNKGSGDEEANANFAGQGSRAGEKTCNADADCDNHDPCTTFHCERGTTAEIAVGHCVYNLSNGAACAGDSGGTITHPLPDPDPDPNPQPEPDASSPVDSGPGEPDSSSPPPDSGSPPPDSGSPPPDAGPTSCSKSLSVTYTNTGLPTCTFSTTVDKSSPATLDYPCAGGAASVTFGAQTFTGTETGGTVSLTSVTKFAFVDTQYNMTCNYVATQTISGALASGSLAYTYKDQLDTGQPTLCKFVTAGCTASGTATVK
jgi:hypothetical protein